MDDLLPIQYREFYDVPRMFIVEFEASMYLFDGSFDDELDEYPDHYTISVLPRMTPADLAGSWELVPAKGIAQIAITPVADIEFDSTKRTAVSSDSIRHAIESVLHKTSRL